MLFLFYCLAALANSKAAVLFKGTEMELNALIVDFVKASQNGLKWLIGNTFVPYSPSYPAQ